jgi:hypothetical protein
MESLGRLGDKLPGAEAEEKELQASFRSAALAITGLFKQGKKATNKGESTTAHSCFPSGSNEVQSGARGVRVDATSQPRKSHASESAKLTSISPLATAYIAGKREALQDVLEFLQTSLDHPSQPAQGPLNVARLIDYICVSSLRLFAKLQDP